MIVTLDEVKSILQISDDSKNELIILFIPIVQGDIIDKTRNSFKDCKIGFYSDSFIFDKASNEIRLTDFDFAGNNFIDGQDINIDGSIHNDGNVEIYSVANGVLIINSTILLSDEDSGNLTYIYSVKYPVALKKIASKMIEYLMETEDGSVAGETIGRYSVSKKDNKLNADYPDEVISGLYKNNYVLGRYV